MFANLHVTEKVELLMTRPMFDWFLMNIQRVTLRTFTWKASPKNIP